MRELMLFDELQHLEPGHSLAVESRDLAGIKLLGLRCELVATRSQGRAQFGRQRTSVTVLRKLRHMPVQHLSKLRSRKVIHPFQKEAGQSVRRIQNMARDFTEARQLGNGPEVELRCREILNGKGRIFADCFPRVQHGWKSYHRFIISMRRYENMRNQSGGEMHRRHFLSLSAASAAVAPATMVAALKGDLSLTC